MARIASKTTAVLLAGLAPAVLFGPAGPSLAATDDCATFPKVPWWGNLSHQSIGQLVEKRYGGDWTAYIRIWERNLHTFRKIRRNKSKAAISTPALKNKRQLLGGKELDKYIKNVSARLSVMRCLANQAEAKTKGKKVAPDGHAANLHEQSAAAGKRLAGRLGCNNCHGESGTSTLPRYPNLARQSELYLIKQLKEFQGVATKGGGTPGAARRHSRTMTARAGRLSEDDVWNLSAHFARLATCPKEKNNPLTPTRPEIAERCVKCHGLAGKSLFPEIPNLAGQHKTYLLNQIKAFRKSGLNKDKGWAPGARYHYFVSPFTRNISDADLTMLADYFSKAGCPKS